MGEVLKDSGADCGKGDCCSILRAGESLARERGQDGGLGRDGEEVFVSLWARSDYECEEKSDLDREMTVEFRGGIGIV